MDVLREAASSRARRVSEDAQPPAKSTTPRKMTMAELMREEEERYDEAEATKRDHAKHAQSLSGSGKDLGTLSNRRGSTARSGLPTHREDPTDDDDDDAIDTTQAKLWNEKELEHMMEDVAAPVEVDNTGLDIFGEHAIRAEDVGPLVLGPLTRVWDEVKGAAPLRLDETLSDPLLDQHLENVLTDKLFVPSGLNCVLREYQKEGVRFIYNLWASGKGGVLADDMGLGKTVQTIAFLGAILRSPVATRTAAYENKPLVVLIVCPTSVITNWESELKKWGEAMGSGYLDATLGGPPEFEYSETFTVARVHGDTKKEQWARVLATCELAMDGNTEHTCVPANVALTSYDTFRLNIDDFKDINWTVVIFDEAHKLKNEKALIYIAAKDLPDVATSPRIGLTGTVMQNTYDELWCLLNWACPGSLGESGEFREYYSRQMQQAQRFSAGDRLLALGRERAQQLKLLLKKYVLTRKKKDVLAKSLPSKADNVVFCDLSPLQLKVYQRLLDTPEFTLIARSGEPCDCDSGEPRGRCCYHVPTGYAPLWETYHDPATNPLLHAEDGCCDKCPNCLILPCIQILLKVSNHLELLKPDPKLVHEDPEKFYREILVATMALGDDAHLLGDANKPDGNFQRVSSATHCGKLLALEKLLNLWHAQNDKVLIFSVSVRLLTILETFLNRRGYVFSRLDGSTGQKHRQQVVDDFNKSQSTFVFLLSTKAGGVGLNIVSANRVVIFDPNWNPALDLQAQDRSYRIGQKKDVDVYRFLTSGTLEELVYQRQVYKQQQSNVATEGIAESRFFEGVQGDADNKGELFGVANMFRKIPKGEEVRMKQLVEREREANEVYRIETARDVAVAPPREERASAAARAAETRGAGGPSAAEAAFAHGVAPSVRPGTADGVLYEHRHDMLVGRATAVEHDRSRCAVDATRERGELDDGDRGPGGPGGHGGNPNQKTKGKEGKGKAPRRAFEQNASDAAERRAAVTATETFEQREQRDADAVVAALAGNEGVSVGEMGRRLLQGTTGDRAAMLREFLVAKKALDTSVLLFH